MVKALSVNALSPPQSCNNLMRSDAAERAPMSSAACRTSVGISPHKMPCPDSSHTARLKQMKREISCPFCHALLYQLRPQESTPSLSEYVQRAPLIESDAQGTYTTCGRCTKRVRVVARQTTLGLDAFDVAHLQAG